MLPVLHAELSDHFWSDQHDEVSAGNYNSTYYVIGFLKLALLKSLSNIPQHFHPQNLKIQQWPFLFVLIHVHMLMHVLKNCIITHLHDVHPLKKMS